MNRVSRAIDLPHVKRSKLCRNNANQQYYHVENGSRKGAELTSKG